MHDDENHHGGLAHDLEVLRKTTWERRRVLRWALGAASLLPLVGCGESSGIGGADGGSGGSGGAGSGGAGGSGGGGAGAGGAGGAGSCARLPEETAGPYPGDGSNGPNVLNQSGIVRSDIRSSFGAFSGTAAGVPLTITLALVNANGSCAPLAGYAVYLWHCDQNGEYSLYGASVTSQNYLRGVQASGSDGMLSFQSIFPGCYSGRWPHIHFEIYPSLDAAAAGSGRVGTSQLALPQAACADAYGAAGYEASVTNLGRITLATDNVFSDGWTRQLATVTGNATDGYVATLTVPVAA